MDWLKVFSRADWHHASQRMQLEYLERIYDQNNALIEGQSLIIQKLKEIMENIEELTTAVNDSITVEESAIALITGLKTALDDAIAKLPVDNGAALSALSASLSAEKDKLAAAITANTPAAPAAAVVSAP